MHFNSFIYSGVELTKVRLSGTQEGLTSPALFTPLLLFPSASLFFLLFKPASSATLKKPPLFPLLRLSPSTKTLISGAGVGVGHTYTHILMEDRSQPWLSSLRHSPHCFKTRPLHTGLELAKEAGMTGQLGAGGYLPLPLQALARQAHGAML